MGKIIYLSRTDTFSASHRLNSNQLSKEENARIYGKCNNINGHGHNFKVELTIRGQVDPVTGLMYNFTDLKKLMNEHIFDVLDHKNLDVDIPHFSNVTSTAENIAVFIWDRLKTVFPGDMLHEIKIYETEKNMASYRGESN